MYDKSSLDKKYFVSSDAYNCPFCNRNNVTFKLKDFSSFDWTNEKKCFVYFVECSSCDKVSMHLSYELIGGEGHHNGHWSHWFHKDIDIDSNLFYSVPTSFFVMDTRIPRVVRELITEAEGCLKMNLLTGASACARKAIYELLVKEQTQGADYESRIKSLREKYHDSDPLLFDILAHIQEMTSDKVHEQSWDKWDSQYLRLIVETLKTVLHDIYVLPAIKKARSTEIQKLQENVKQDKKQRSPT